MSVKENLIALKNKLPLSCTLVAVSKTKPNDLLMEAYSCGQRDFGENYVQELCAKYEALPKDIRWHFIGHLQSNKVKYIVPFVHLIHGVDSKKLLLEINKQSIKQKINTRVLLQYYIAKEESKFGLDDSELNEIITIYANAELTGITILGLMGMASNTNDQNVIISEFNSIQDKFNEIKKILGANFNTLSIGMSGDYELALKSGSNMVRIGSSIFGARSYKP
jgi:pyridoxal phosphate enzyme (YggS family)